MDGQFGRVVFRLENETLTVRVYMMLCVSMPIYIEVRSLNPINR